MSVTTLPETTGHSLTHIIAVIQDPRLAQGLKSGNCGTDDGKSSARYAMVTLTPHRPQGEEDQGGRDRRGEEAP